MGKKRDTHVRGRGGIQIKCPRAPTGGKWWCKAPEESAQARQWTPPRQQVYDKCGGHCFYCGGRLKFIHMTIDHVVPKVFGGNDSFANLVPCCYQCNQRKGGMPLVAYKEYLGVKVFFGEKYIAYKRTGFAKRSDFEVEY